MHLTKICAETRIVRKEEECGITVMSLCTRLAAKSSQNCLLISTHVCSVMLSSTAAKLKAAGWQGERAYYFRFPGN